MSNLPVRERILAKLVNLLEEVATLGGEPDLTWERIVRAPITDEDRKLKSVISVEEGRETNGTMSVAEEKFLDVQFEFEIKAYLGESPSTFMNLVMADLQKLLSAHSQLDGLCLHVRVTGSDVDIGGETDRRVGGIVFATIHYRHVYGDPCRLIGE